MGSRIRQVSMRFMHRNWEKGLLAYDATRICVKYVFRFIRHLAGEIAQEWADLTENDAEKKEKLMTLSKDIVPYHMKHNAEAEACDLLMEIECINLVEQYVDESVYARVCLYLTRCVRNIILFNQYHYMAVLQCSL